jgi:hypothetical protein
MTFDEFKKQWGVDGMPSDKQRIAAAAWKAAQEDMRERCAVILDNRADVTGENFVWHACRELANKIRALKLDGDV